MGIVKTEFTHIECNGPAATPFRTHCTAEAEGGWDQEAVEAAALAEGWTNPQGRSWFCLKHSASPAEKQVRKTRAVPEQSAD